MDAEGTKKTVSVALSKEQYLWMQEATDNWHILQETLKRMEQISRTILFHTIPEPNRRKSLDKNVFMPYLSAIRDSP